MGNWFSDFFGGGDNETQQVVQNDLRPAPEFPEAAGARATWADTLTRWGSQPGYGAIQPNWNDIWENARGKVSRYFGGGPEGPGVDAKVAANSAKRGVADQAAGDAMLQRSSFQQGNMLQDLAIKQAMEEANLSEGGRKDWMTSLMSLADQKPQMLNYGSTTDTTYQPPSIAGKLGKAFVGSQNGTGTGIPELDQIMQMFGGDGGQQYSGDTGIGDMSGVSTGDEGDGGDMWSDPQTYAQIAQLAMMFI